MGRSAGFSGGIAAAVAAVADGRAWEEPAPDPCACRPAICPPCHRLVHSEALQRACPIPFDEGRLWKGDDSEALRAQLQVGGGGGTHTTHA